MAYVTGIANDLGALLTSIRNACVANGWTLSGDVLHKGDIYIRTQQVGNTLTFLGGTGIDESNDLTGSGPAVVRMRQFGQAFTFPMTYEVHINTDPDEVYVIVNYAVNFYQWAAWGISDVADLPGSGVWYAASQAASDSSSISVFANVSTANAPNIAPTLLGLSSPSGKQNGFIHHGLDGGGWNGSNGPVISWLAAQPMHGMLPNQWNSETILLPISAWIPRTGNKVSLVADLKHARYCRINFHDPGQIISLGSDQWKLYPWYAKDASTPNGAADAQHTGTFGLAVRYTES